MRAPLSWLREFVPLEGRTEDLAATFSNLGLVVDGVEIVGTGLGGVVVARVLALRRHPGADKIQLVDVDAGSGDALQIACGAFNFAVGDLVPLATLGAVMPDGSQIGRRKLRGEWSNGMLCSASELRLAGRVGENGILVLPAGVAAPGTPLTEALGLLPDVVFDLDITPNRPDALSIAGVARDIAAALGVPFKLPGFATVAGPGPGGAAVTVRDPDLCPRFTGTVVTGVKVGPSPDWIARRLTLAGMRAINNVVDVSNYVMLELGQPNHAYDLDKLPGRGLVVRRAQAGERVVTLDGVERALGDDDCLICDAASTPVGIAGIMGGASSEISDATTTVLLEAAYFDPMAIARTGKRLGLNSEARSRFERGCDPEIIELAVDRFVSLLAGASRGTTTDVRSQRHTPVARPVAVRTERVNGVLGVSLTSAVVAALLAPIGFTSKRTPDGGVLEVTIPTWRPDSEREIDVIEEVARLYGYSNIERTLPAGIRAGVGLTAYQRDRRRVRDILVGAGLTEAWTTTFLGPGDLERAGLPAQAVEVENPLDRSESLLRTSLLPGLLKAVRFNGDRQLGDVRLFEVGHVFALPSGAGVLPSEREDLAVIVAGEGGGARLAARLWAVLAGALRLDAVSIDAAPMAAGPPPLDAVSIDAAPIAAGSRPTDGASAAAGPIPGLHPTRSARIFAAGSAIGALGEVDPAVAGAYGLSGRVGFLSVSLEALLVAPRRSDQARPISRFPASDFDLAFVVGDGVAAGAVEATLRKAGGDLLEWVRLFDVYRDAQLGANRRSLAYHLRIRALDRTLTDAQVAEVRQRAIEEVALAHDGELRG